VTTTAQPLSAPHFQEGLDLPATATPRYSPPPALSRNAYPVDSRCATGVVLLIDPKALELIVVPTLCHRWDCPVCGPIRMRKAKAIAVAGNPERMITLTTRPKPGWTTEASVRWFRRRWQALLVWLRRNFDRFEYIAFVEFHKSDWPHMHILTRGSYVPQRMLSAEWLRLTGSFKAHIQGVTNGWQQINETTKYYLKTARQVHEHCPNLPVYTKSKGWLPPDWEDTKTDNPKLELYAFASVRWATLLEHVEAMGASLEPRPGCGARFTLQLRAPPDAAHVAMMYDIGSFADKTLVAAVDLFYSQRARGPLDIAHLKERVEFASTLPEQW